MATIYYRIRTHRANLSQFWTNVSLEEKLLFPIQSVRSNVFVRERKTVPNENVIENEIEENLE